MQCSFVSTIRSPPELQTNNREAKSKKLVKPKAPARRGAQAATVNDQPTESIPTQRATDSERQTREEKGEHGARIGSFVAPVAPMSIGATETRRRGLRSQEQGDSTIAAPDVDVQHDSESSTRMRSGRRTGKTTTLPSANIGSAVIGDSEQTPIEIVTIPDVIESVALLTPPASQAVAGGFIRKSKKTITPKAQTRRQRASVERAQSADRNNTTGETANGVTSTTPIVIDQQAETDSVAHRLLMALVNHEHEHSLANGSSSSNQATAPSGSTHATNQTILQSNGASDIGEIAGGSVTVTDSRTTQRSSRKRKQAPTNAEAEQETTQSARSGRGRSKKSASRPTSVKPIADAEAHNSIEINEEERRGRLQKTKDRKRRRASTPEDASTRRIEPTEVRMDALIVDPRQGQISQREQRLRQRDVELKERKLKAAQTLAREQLQEIMTEDAADDQPNPTATTSTPNLLSRSPSPNATVTAPQFRIVNGQIVADESSRIIDRRAERTRAAEAPDENTSVIEEDDLSRRINGRSYTKYDKPTRWSPAATELFHKGLQYFGLEFSMMACLFPGRSRRQLKAKFIREERADVAFVNALLKDRQPIPSREELEAMMGKKLKDPKELAEELRVQKEALEEAQRVEDQRADERRLAREKEAEKEGERVKDGDEDNEEDEEEQEEEEEQQQVAEENDIPEDDAIEQEDERQQQQQQQQQEEEEEEEDDDDDEEEETDEDE